MLNKIENNLPFFLAGFEPAGDFLEECGIKETEELVDILVSARRDWKAVECDPEGLTAAQDKELDLIAEETTKLIMKELIKPLMALFLKDEPALETAEVIDESLTQVHLANLVNDEKLIEFYLVYRESESDSWLQSEYYSEAIKKVIILDFEWPTYIEEEDGYSALEKFCIFLLEEEDERKALETKLTKLNTNL